MPLHVLAVARDLMPLLAQHQVVLRRAVTGDDLDSPRRKFPRHPLQDVDEPRVHVGGLVGKVIAQEDTEAAVDLVPFTGKNRQRLVRPDVVERRDRLDPFAGPQLRIALGRVGSARRPARARGAAGRRPAREVAVRHMHVGTQRLLAQPFLFLGKHPRLAGREVLPRAVTGSNRRSDGPDGSILDICETWSTGIARQANNAITPQV